MTLRHWYTARCLFRHDTDGASGGSLYEERMILLHSVSAEAAILAAEDDARAYAAASDAVYLGFVETYQLAVAAVGHGSEVFSLMRSSPLSAAAFVTRYYDDGSEHRAAAGDEPDSVV